MILSCLRMSLRLFSSVSSKSSIFTSSLPFAVDTKHYTQLYEYQAREEVGVIYRMFALYLHLALGYLHQVRLFHLL